MNKTTLFSRSILRSIREKCLSAYQNAPYPTLMSRFSANPFQNPIARAIRDHPPQFTPEEQSVVSACTDSARLVVEKNHIAVLHNFFNETAATNTVMGRFYRTLTFDDFLLRLFQKRYHVVFLDGHLIVSRDSTDALAKMLKTTRRNNFLTLAPSFIYREILLKVGTEADREKLYEEYITLKEMMLTPLVLPQAISIMIGNGSREDHWPVLKEAEMSTDIAVMSSAVGPEFSDGNTLHFDLLFCTVIEKASSEIEKRIGEIKHDEPLMHAARAIYGEKLAIDFTAEEASQNKSGEFVRLEVGEEQFWLYKPAYFARLKMLLKTLLLSSDEAMQRAGTGSVYNLKGLGLGAFGFSGVNNQIILEQLFVDVVKEVLIEISEELQHITIVNLINLPSDMRDKKAREKPKAIADYGSVQLMRSVMNPTDKTIPTGDAEVGGTHSCGDAGAKFGNEGVRGADRASSDDPAALYSLKDPTILDPSINSKLRSIDCIVLLDTKINLLTPLKDDSYSSNLGDKYEENVVRNKFS